nr:MAG TPA: DPS family protein, DPS family protein, SAD.67A [Caudoviricetes sp.]
MNEMQRLIMFLKIQYHNMGILHRYLSGDSSWFENHEELDDWKVCIAKQIDEVCEEAQALGYTEPSLKDALLAFGGEEISPEYRGLNETFRIAQGIMRSITGLMQAAVKDVPASVANRLQEMEYKWNKIADYKIARVLGDNLQKQEVYEDD